MSKHTPGPWTAYHDTYHDTWSVEGDGDVVADLWRLSEETHSRHPHFEDEVEANAQLIAAAPDLLEALMDLVDACPCQNGCEKDDMSCATMKARAAIAKATSSA